MKARVAAFLIQPCVISLWSGTNKLYLQVLGGWADLNMVKSFAQMVHEDLLQAQQEHGPLDGLIG